MPLMIILVVCPDKIVDTHDYIKIMEFTIYSELHYSSTGTDGRPIICKKTSVTGRHNRPMMLFLKGTLLLYSQIVAGIFNLQSFDASDI